MPRGGVYDGVGWVACRDIDECLTTFPARGHGSVQEMMHDITAADMTCRFMDRQVTGNHTRSPRLTY
jgi:hypothetical protein